MVAATSGGGNQDVVMHIGHGEKGRLLHKLRYVYLS